MTQTAWLKTFTEYHKHTRCWTVWKGRRFDGLAGQWLLIRSRRIRPNCKTIFDTNLFNWSILSICDISTYKSNIWHMNLTCRNCGQKRGERLQVHAGLLRCTLKRGFATPGCIAPAHICGSYTSTFKFKPYFVNSLNTGDTSGEEGDRSGEGAGDGSHRPDLKINLKGCYTVIYRPFELVTNIQGSPMKRKHLRKIRCWGPFMLDGSANP